MNQILITDLEQVRALAEELNDENADFRMWVKGYLTWSDRRLDRCVRELYAEVKSGIDCAACRNCCRELAPEATAELVAVMARRLGLSVEEFRTRHVKKDRLSEEGIEPPCPCLVDNACCLSDDEAPDCRSYPFLDRGDFRSRSLNAIVNAGVCPIVFNVLQRLKAETGWRPRRQRRRRW